ncbi:MAG: DUF2235 domain-containing protein [Rhizorhabdus sp.]|uniref:phospholipase effector Tle1 domain-containing protein n=1 Tax=Rhizorhabdus sp. TaxID=1968843 RepID=UPI001B669915|nr:DUF2235 domain-containing protein [Rhizorhabdus sp.]MBP8232856.1 DUF2235 domain-containing protein [Rhizorhabdus sp.]
MKRIVFCFDGTWNKLSADTPTNVVLTAASIERITPNGIAQIIHYDEGVGTDRLETVSGGMFGSGLVANIREAYRFLIFNYDPGDQIYVFGFSRGAFSARTFVGFLRHVGPLSRLHAERIDEALSLYERRLRQADGAADALRRFRATYAAGVCIGAEDDAWRVANVEGYVTGDAPCLTVRYLGLWDTVSALGIPAFLPGSSWINRKHRFHDAELTSFVENARHAVAIDERRKMFPATLLGDLTNLNRDKGYTSEADDAPYQERWFPGVHGAVGGGGDIRGLSDGALSWVVKGAKMAGLRLDVGRGSRIHRFEPDPLAPLVNVKKRTFSFTQLLKTDRPGPEHLWQLAPATLRRWKAAANDIPEKKLYRPATLAAVARKLDATRLPAAATGTVIARHRVEQGESLSKLAKRYYGDMTLGNLIFDANRDQLDDPNDIFVGQTLRIPEQQNL